MSKRNKKIKKSKRKKQFEDPNSRLWRNKADIAWSKAIHEKYDHKCDVCGSTKFCQAHHLIPRFMFSHRYSIQNGILLCCLHHKYSIDLSAHKASLSFLKWLLENRQETWSWFLDQKPSKESTSSYKDSFLSLTNSTQGEKNDLPS